ncbi:MAG: hypothetical protein ACU0DK_09950 [Pseudooceanicola sp.]
MRFFRPVSYAMVCLFGLLAPHVGAQDLRVGGDTYPLGTSIEYAIDLPEVDGFPGYAVAIRRPGVEDEVTSDIFRYPASEARKLRAPTLPGRYEMILRTLDGALLRRYPLDIRFVPAPGAMSGAPDRAMVGETVRINVRIPEGIYQPSPWVGLFSTGRLAQGGASMADQLQDWKWVSEGTVAFRMPRRPGIYEFRLNDRRDGRLVLDRHRIEVREWPAPGALSIDRDEVEVSNLVTVTAKLEESRRLDRTWIGLFRPGATLEGGAVRPDDRVDWKWMDKESFTSVFRVPTRPGRYEFRLFDTDGDWVRELDRIAFDIGVSGQPDAIKLDRSDYVIGERIPVPISLRSDRNYGRSWIGLFRVHEEGDGENAPREDYRYDWAWANDGETPHLTIPSRPGVFELRLFDREGTAYVLDRDRITVTAPPTPAALAMNKLEFDIGERIVVTATLEEGRYYNRPQVRIYRVEPDTTESGLAIHRDHADWGWVESGKPVAFRGLAWPGTYEVRLYDRSANGYVLDTARVEVVARRHEAALETDKAVYNIGEPVHIRVAFPEGHYNGRAQILLRNLPATENPDDAPWLEQTQGWHWIDVERPEYELVAPYRPGRYEILLTDRPGRTVAIARKEVEVLARPLNLLQISGRDFAPGERIEIRTRWPGDFRMPSPGVAVYRSSYVLEDGGFAWEQEVMSRRFPAEGEVIGFDAPNGTGEYEVRVYDRNNSYYVLDIERFTVSAPNQRQLVRRPFRLTPLPGSGGGAPTTPVSLPPGADGRATDRPAPSPGGDGPGPEERTATPGDTVPTERPSSDAERQADSSGEDTGDDTAPGAPRPVALNVRMLGPSGLVPVTKLIPGQSFIVEATYDSPPEAGEVSARLAFGDGGATEVTLSATGDGTVLRSNVLRVPVAKGDAQ